MFKLEHPHNLISRMFILEYMRELGAEVLHSKAKPEQRKAMFYKFSNDEGDLSVDINWEYMLFNATIPQLEGIMQLYLPQIEVIDKKREVEMKKLAATMVNEEINTPTDINLLDYAKAVVRNTQGDSNGIIQ